MKDVEVVEYLSVLSITYELLQGPSLQVVLCGGAGLLALGLIDRGTKDVDLLGPPALPDPFWEAAKATAQYFQLPDDWINQGPADLWGSGLPEGFNERCILLKLKTPSTKLSFLLSSRYDQIHFKLYAAVDHGPGPSRHLQDLIHLQPTMAELIGASRWCLSQDVSEGFRGILLDMLKKQGWQDVVSQLG